MLYTPSPSSISVQLGAALPPVCRLRHSYWPRSQLPMSLPESTAGFPMSGCPLRVTLFRAYPCVPCNPPHPRRSSDKLSRRVNAGLGLPFLEVAQSRHPDVSRNPPQPDGYCVDRLNNPGRVVGSRQQAQQPRHGDLEFVPAPSTLSCAQTFSHPTIGFPTLQPRSKSWGSRGESWGTARNHRGTSPLPPAWRRQRATPSVDSSRRYTPLLARSGNQVMHSRRLWAAERITKGRAPALPKHCPLAGQGSNCRFNRRLNSIAATQALATRVLAGC